MQNDTQEAGFPQSTISTVVGLGNAAKQAISEQPSLVSRMCANEVAWMPPDRALLQSEARVRLLELRAENAWIALEGRREP